MTAKDIKAADEILNSFEIARVMKEKLDNIAYTPDQLEYIVGYIVKVIIKL